MTFSILIYFAGALAVISLCILMKLSFQFSNIHYPYSRQSGGLSLLLFVVTMFIGSMAVLVIAIKDQKSLEFTDNPSTMPNQLLTTNNSVFPRTGRSISFAGLVDTNDMVVAIQVQPDPAEIEISSQKIELANLSSVNKKE